MLLPLPTMLDKFCEFEQTRANKLFLAEPVKGVYQTFTWQQAGSQVRRMAAALRGMGLGKDDKVAILSKNCAHWIMADLAISMAGCISVPLYPNITPDALREIIDHSESKAIFIGKLDNPEELRTGVPDNLLQISFPFYPNAGCLNWDELIEGQDGITGKPDIDPQALACIVYTSGTTGQPKGVMHTFYAIAYAVDAFLVSYPEIKEEIFFSYLPLCHVAERMLVECGAIFTGSTVYFVESMDTFAANLAHTRPTIFLAVPRIWEKLQEGILKKIPQQKLNRLLSIPLVSTVIKKAIKKKLGLTNARFLFTGASPINPALLHWFARLDIVIQEAYGMTENLALSHSNRRGSVKFGTVGQSYTGVEVRLGKDNEVQVKSPANMLGYYKEPGLTAECFEDGFLRTGDEGSIDSEGYLTITGRIKDQFKTSKGKYIMPAPVESKLLQTPELAQVCVVGSGMPNAMALCTLSESARKHAVEQLQEILHHALAAVNKSLEHHEQLTKLIVLPEEWTIQNGLLTPTLKIKRKMIDASFGELYHEWSRATHKVIFA
ncbi:MAG: AMP-binding protein [Chitinophagaceae bacterium]|nr:AMP-binding protein [Chitinophagaceae bacterium]MCA6452625.1 AMP-binding protein [Chitinophagaceae bacterium]MCA6455353.1 AMP-binding protein [Chitinophagaceae bacterium]MCA6459095.1 AMP-binding protein [Chitinophagaceae bacterium]MCA6465625.1 AMP-binding protein [Chitinophagaceae bacterium]